MSAEPGASAWPEGYGRIVLEETDSTNRHAARIADTLAGPTWILARRQTAGHGRRGRPWAMAEGNFAATLLTRPEGTPAQVALRSFVAALALHEALADVTGQPGSLSLKWPNDVLLNGGKVAGILLESVGAGMSVGWLAVGIGVNLASAPDLSEVEAGATRPVSVLGECGCHATPEAFLERLAAAYAPWEAKMATFGFGPVRAAWLQRAARLGEAITARTGGASYEGVFDTIDHSGALVLRTPGGMRAVAAAEVFF